MTFTEVKIRCRFRSRIDFANCSACGSIASASLPLFRWTRVSQPKLRHWSYSVGKIAQEIEIEPCKSTTTDSQGVKLKIRQTFSVAQTQEQDGG